MSRPLSDCAVVITGGTSGVGLASAHQFAESGVTRLALIGRDAERGESARAAVQDAHPKTVVHFLAADANDPAQATDVSRQAHDLLGGLDVLVNCTAAAYRPQLIKDLPIEDFAAILTQQALAPLHMSRVALEFMVPQRFGVIVNVASDAAKVPTPGETVIGAAMAAIVSFTRTLAIEVKRDGIRANVLTPSLINGTITAERVMADGFSKKLFTKAAELAHLGVAEPDDLAALIVFLAGPGAGKLTGQAISVNGGISAA
jgi:NAD(P)-dependent dehydrogenase (short-subunit alcohol dehydrogenase family)